MGYHIPAVAAPYRERYGLSRLTPYRNGEGEDQYYEDPSTCLGILYVHSCLPSRKFVHWYPVKVVRPVYRGAANAFVLGG